MASTADAPMATCEATLPLASIRTADGVPLAPNFVPTLNDGSRTMRDCKPIASFASEVPVETTSSFGFLPESSLPTLSGHPTCGCRSRSQGSRTGRASHARGIGTGSRSCQSDPGAFNDRRSVFDLWCSLDYRCPTIPIPVVLATLTAPVLPCSGAMGCTGATAGTAGGRTVAGAPTVSATSPADRAAPRASGLPIVPSGRTTTALGVPWA